jgi:asparagine N-glycosylation enzyme membrane subunit Stt3
VALLPATIRQSFVGRPDHHVLEVLLAGVALLAYASEIRRDRAGWARPALLGAALALSFWNWSGSALSLLFLAAHVGLLHLLAPLGDPAPVRAARALGLGGLAAALLLAATVAAFGPPGALRSAGLTPITGLSVALCALAALGAAAVAAARRLDPSAGPLHRAAHLATLCLAVLAGGSVLPGAARAGLDQGLTALAASSAWYSTIPEFWPLVGSGRQPWTTEVLLALFSFGLTPLALPAAAALLATSWRRSPGLRPTLSLLAVWVVGLLALALLRRRFEGYAVVGFAVCAAWSARALAARLPARLRGPAWIPPAAEVAALLALASPGFPVALTGAVAEPQAGAAEKHPLLRWLAGVPAPPGREGVLSSWSEGHEILAIARKPVVSTPFGTDIDRRSLEDQAVFFTVADPEAAAALLRRRQVGFLLLHNPVREIATMGPFSRGAPVWAIEERGLSTGSSYAMRPEIFDLVVSRLYFLDGGSRSGKASALGSYRLLAESPSPVSVLGFTARAYKLFGVVEGALLSVRGARPGAAVTATLPVATVAGRRFLWATSVNADWNGAARLRVPYASGVNGTSLAGPVAVGDGERSRVVTLDEARVVGGLEVPVDLAR